MDQKREQDCTLCFPSMEEDVVSRNEKWRIILADEPDYPGFCRLIWNSHVREMTDLPEGDRNEMMCVIWDIEKIIRDVMNPSKINLATLGNMVPHIHWHIIPRFDDDINFPGSVWSVKEREATNTMLDVRRALLPELKKRIRRLLQKK